MRRLLHPLIIYAFIDLMMRRHGMYDVKTMHLSKILFDNDIVQQSVFIFLSELRFAYNNQNV